MPNPLTGPRQEKEGVEGNSTTSNRVYMGHSQRRTPVSLDNVNSLQFIGPQYRVSTCVVETQTFGSYMCAEWGRDGSEGGRDKRVG